VRNKELHRCLNQVVEHYSLPLKVSEKRGFLGLLGRFSLWQFTHRERYLVGLSIQYNTSGGSV
jgi:hypothetical protein